MCSALTGGKFKHSAVWVVVDSGLGRSIARAATDLGCTVQVAVTDHLDVEHLDSVWTGRFSHLVGRLLKFDSGSWWKRRKVTGLPSSGYTWLCEYYGARICK